MPLPDLPDLPALPALPDVPGLPEGDADSDPGTCADEIQPPAADAAARSGGPGQMHGVRLPGGRRVQHVMVAVPEPGHGQVLVRTRASSICGSDIRAIYREHLGEGPEAYQGVIAGHEPAGEVVAVGQGCRARQVGDRVALYHIAGCGVCAECRHGYLIGCLDPSRAAYGWQRDGGHAEYVLAEESTALPIPHPLTYVDGALVSCGFSTAYEALLRLEVSGRDALLITGLGPVGLAAAMLGQAMGAALVIGSDLAPQRLDQASRLGLVDYALPADAQLVEHVLELTGGEGCEKSLDASGAGAARVAALRATGRWGRCAFVGEGGQITFAVSELMIHKQLTVYGSWVSSLGHMEELMDNLVRWNLSPQTIVSHRFPLAEADQAYAVADAGTSGKVCITFE